MELTPQPKKNGARNHANGAAESARTAVERARKAAQIWADKPLQWRIKAIERAAKRMLADREEVVALASAELGKCDVECVFNEALGALDSVSNWSKVVRAAVGPNRVPLNPIGFPNKSATVELVPRGVIGIIAPWNYPMSGLFRSMLPALLTGNGVVLKPSEHSPRTSSWYAEQLARELPAGLVQVVQGDGSVGEALLEAGIDACVFTGSIKAGRSVQARCGELGIPSSIEMGGKDAAIILADADLDRTVAGVTHWSLSNAGQACGAIEIAYVDKRIADAFVDRMRRAWSRLNTNAKASGSGEVDVAPLANARQLQVVEAQVADAIAKGAKAAHGGARTGRGFGYVPTLLDHCNATMDVVRDETFGPVLAVVRIEGASDAVMAINEARYGLGASIWTSDLNRGKRLAGKLDVGIVTINNHAFTGAIPALPWSGTRDTGFGIANSEHALLTFARPKAVVVDESKSPEFFWMPYDNALLELGHILADAQIGKLLRAWKIPLGFRKRTARIREFFRG